jgi:hypothetical protein
LEITDREAANPNLPVPSELVERRIYSIRGQKVMLSPDLAELYEVETRALVQAVKRNMDRFPEDFMFQLTLEEFAVLKSQIVISSWGGARRGTPYAFTEHGVLMLSSVLQSKRAVQVNIVIMRAFVKLRELLATHKDLARKLEDLERKYQTHDTQIKAVFDAIRRLLAPPKRPKQRIGFRVSPVDIKKKKK